MRATAQDVSRDPIRVMVVDDSAVVRSLVSGMLEEEPGISVVGRMSNGQLAVTHLRRQPADVVILDIEMPVMDGLTALPKLLEVDPDVKIIMASTLTERNADISIRALNAGAADYVPKPSSAGALKAGSDFRRELISKVMTLGATRRKRAALRPATVTGPTPSLLSSGPIALRKPGPARAHVIAVGSSTGGPQALFAFLRDLKVEIGLPLVITQHMPPTFTAILAEHISAQTAWPCTEAKDGDVIQPGRGYLAPGGYHLTVVAEGTQKIVRLNQDPPENFCRPAVDPMLRSIAKAYSGHVLTVILTGMGADGLKGGEAVIAAGGTVIAQDERTSVVWGMPGAVATAGLCSAVLPLSELAPYVNQSVKGGAA